MVAPSSPYDDDDDDKTDHSRSPVPSNNHHSNADEPTLTSSELSSPSFSEALSPIDDSSNASSSVRATLGAGTATLSDVINDNLVAARYAAIASIGLLAAYGLSQTPLFFRYRTVADLPASWVRERRTLHGRLMVCRTSQSPEQSPATNGIGGGGGGGGGVSTTNIASSITCHMRHLSPMERILSKPWLDRVLQFHPAASFSKHRIEESPHELMEIQIAGVVDPTATVQKHNESTSSSHQPASSSLLHQISMPRMMMDVDQPKRSDVQAWLERLAEQRVPVQCQLLARRRCTTTRPGGSSSSSSSLAKRPLPILDPTTTTTTTTTTTQHGVEGEAPLPPGSSVAAATVVAHLSFRPPHQWRRTDLGTHLVHRGLAVPSTDGLYGSCNDTVVGNDSSTTTTTIVDTTSAIRDVQRDVRYMEGLGAAEYEACRASRGVWSDPAYRAERGELVEELEFQEHAPAWRKLWRWWRG